MLSDLTDLEILTGILTIIYIVFDFFVGFLCFSKIKTAESQKILLFIMGIFVITLSSPWWPVAIQFLLYISNDIIMDTISYLFLTYWLVPLGMIFWLWIVYKLAFYKNMKYIAFFIWSVVTCVGFYIFIMICLFINTPLIGSKEGYMNVTFNVIPNILSIYGLTINLISGGIFFYKSWKAASTSKEYTSIVKALFMFLGFGFFTFSAIFQTVPVIDIPLIAVILKITAILSALCFYFVFFLPKILIKRLKIK